LRIRYKASVKKDLKKLDPPDRIKVLDTIEETLRKDPMAGKHLKGEWHGCRRLAKGKIRVIYTLDEEGVLVLRISFRRDVYR
jgi:mRNA-degrading endonuclease RelE of RelBE toxin-antitoxin system